MKEKTQAMKNVIITKKEKELQHEIESAVGSAKYKAAKEIGIKADTYTRRFNNPEDFRLKDITRIFKFKPGEIYDVIIQLSLKKRGLIK